jgi:uncharacterized protein involved in response to NO
MLISSIGGRIIPSFTRNWLAKQPQCQVSVPLPFDWPDRTTLGITLIALVFSAIVPDGTVTPWLCLITGFAHGTRLIRWRGFATLSEPLLWVLHLGYGWLALGFCLVGLNALVPWLPQTAALHALVIGAIGTMTLAVMTRATLRHTGRSLTADRETMIIYGLVTLAAVFPVLAPLAGEQYVLILSLGGAMWSSAFAMFALH